MIPDTLRDRLLKNANSVMSRPIWIYTVCPLTFEFSVLYGISCYLHGN